MEMITVLRGSNFRPREAKDVIEELVEGDPVQLEREADNKHDSNAIKVFAQGEHIGYVAKEHAIMFSSLWDEAPNLIAKGVVTTSNDRSPTLKITLSSPDE